MHVLYKTGALHNGGVEVIKNCASERKEIERIRVWICTDLADAAIYVMKGMGTAGSIHVALVDAIATARVEFGRELVTETLVNMGLENFDR